MDLVEYLLFIPLLIYGIALSHLLGGWKRFFDLTNWHWPYIVTIVVFTEVAIWNIYTFLDVFTQDPAHSYLSYLGLLAPPFLLLLAVNALVKEEDRDGLVDPEEFSERMRLSYFFMGCLVALHLLPGYGVGGGQLFVRLPAVAVLFGVAWLRRRRLIYLLGAIWVVSLVQRARLGS